MRVLVCGGRDYTDFDTVYWTLKSLGHIRIIIHGGARGADDLAARYARVCSIPVLCFPAQWKLCGRKAGPLRNERMLREGKPDLVVAFPGGKGTADMVKRARRAGVKVKEIFRYGKEIETNPQDTEA